MPTRQQVVKQEDGIALLVADVYEAAGALRRLGETLAAAEGQTQARWQLLSVVSERPLTVPQAARRLGISRQAVQRVADDAVGQGMASFQANPEHRGSPLVELTPSGRDVLANINERAQQFNRHPDLLLTGPDIETARRVLRALVEHARKSVGDDRH
jgi:DNA-binding MarR family transcriptional regulator